MLDAGLCGALLFFSAAHRHSALARSGIAASTREPADTAIQTQNLPTICVCDLLLFVNIHLRFACSGGHSPFDPGRGPLSAGIMSHSQCHIHMTCLMEIKRETRPPPAGANTTERIDASCRLSMTSMPSWGVASQITQVGYPWDAFLRVLLRALRHGVWS
jgi:hypothetical protein